MHHCYHFVLVVIFFYANHDISLENDIITLPDKMNNRTSTTQKTRKQITLMARKAKAKFVITECNYRPFSSFLSSSSFHEFNKPGSKRYINWPEKWILQRQNWKCKKSTRQPNILRSICPVQNTYYRSRQKEVRDIISPSNLNYKRNII